ncbi:OmpA family protein [bacterium]|jgi:ABC-type nitrate/sulfonate/bicarbonate transport system substrate-binding protein|nr:OmpA family protein [bacterium]MDB4745669.1 OmpA family protein [Verrucomicrobiota bacterium]
MSQKKAKGCLVASVLWCIILVVLAIAYKFLVHPFLSEKLTEDTGSSSQYQEEIRIAADSFSGYSILRSDAVKQALRSDGIKLTLTDDEADYEARLESLKNGETDLAVFTIDSYLTAGAKAGEFPGSIVLIIDETKGGDAIVAKPEAISSLQDLNDPAARIVLTPNSPSEFLARVVLAHFNLPNLPENWASPADGPKAVFDLARRVGRKEKKAFVLWEPYVSRAVNEHGHQILLDSSKLEGYIVDVLVAQRSFLRDHPEKVSTVVQAYLRAAFKYSQSETGMLELVQKDASNTGGERLDDAQAKRVVSGIQWKNTLENYAHFGLNQQSGSTSVPHLEDIIMNIVDVLVKTKGIDRDPLDGSYHSLFYQKILADLQSDEFHPGRNINVVSGIGDDLNSLEQVRTTQQGVAISDSQWSQLRPVGELKIKPLVFVRGSSRVSITSKRDLTEVAKKLKTFPEFYVRLIGQTRAEGDPDANRLLAEQRAGAVAKRLIDDGIGEQRIRIEAAPSVERSGAAQSVRFVLGQLPY